MLKYNYNKLKKRFGVVVMKFLKNYWKKFVGVSLVALLTIESSGVLTNVFGSRIRKNVGGQPVTSSSKKNFKARADRVKKILKIKGNLFNNKGIIKVIILDCGMYCNVFHSRGYESHHLISRKFCKNHSNIICPNEAPSVLIPHDIHTKTGSYGASADSEYFKKEEECFKKGGLRAVLRFGLSDLKNSFEKSKIEYGIILNRDSPIVIKLNSYADLFDARAVVRKTGNAQAVNKMRFIRARCIFTPLKRKINNEMDQKSQEQCAKVVIPSFLEELNRAEAE